jgi:hypothetical protein
MSTRPWFVYSLRDPRDGAIRYVGTTVQSLDIRLRQHLCVQLKINNPKMVWLRELNTLGLRLAIVALETVEDHTYSLGHARAKEAIWIDRVLADGADLTNRQNVLRSTAKNGPGRRLLNVIHARGLSNRQAGKALGVTGETIWTWIMEYTAPEPDGRTTRFFLLIGGPVGACDPSPPHPPPNPTARASGKEHLCLHCLPCLPS